MNRLPTVYQIRQPDVWLAEDGVSLSGSAADLRKHYPCGYTIEMVSPSWMMTNPGLRLALRRNQALAECADGEPLEAEAQV